MKNRKDERATISCRIARRQFGTLARLELAHPLKKSRNGLALSEISGHIETCSQCAEEYRLMFLSCAALDLAASPKPVRPDEDFFRSLRARIERGPAPESRPAVDESWAAALLLTARQLFPVMAVLLLLIIGATFIWNGAPKENRQMASELRPRDRIIFTDLYEFPEPTRDDVLETLVAVEEKKNGK